MSRSTRIPSFQPPASLTLHHFAPRVKNRKRPPKSKVAPPHIPPPTRIAVLGGGLAGLAVVYHLLHSTARLARKRKFDSSSLRISILDPCNPGEGGASAAAAGLLHGFTPRAKRKCWMSLRGVHAARKLLDVAREWRGGEGVYKECGLVRLALDGKLEEDFRVAARRFPKEVEFLEKGDIRRMCPASSGVPGLLLKEAVVVDVPNYLNALWGVCEKSGRVEWVKEKVSSVGEVFEKGFDAVVVCMGAAVKSVEGLEDVPITPCRGQNLILEGGEGVPMPVISGRYLVPNYFGKEGQLLAGATFEYRKDGQSVAEFVEEGGMVDVERASRELKLTVDRLAPGLFEGWRIVGANAGMRALAPRSEVGSIPIACRVEGVGDPGGCWLVTGLGSRGLLHHGYIGRMMAHAVVAGNEKLIPNDARRFHIGIREKVGGPAVVQRLVG